MRHSVSKAPPAGRNRRRSALFFLMAWLLAAGPAAAERQAAAKQGAADQPARKAAAKAILPKKPALREKTAESPKKSKISRKAPPAGKKASSAPAPEPAEAPGPSPDPKKSARAAAKAGSGNPKRPPAAARRPGQNIQRGLKSRVSALLQACCADQPEAAGRLSLFADHLDEWEQWIILEKTGRRLKQEDHLLLNEILSQIRELPYRQIPREGGAAPQAAALKKAFEHNYRYDYSLSESDPISPFWARGILKALSCLAPEAPSQNQASQNQKGEI